MKIPAATLDHQSLFHAVMATVSSSILIFDENAGLLTANHKFLENSGGDLNAIMGRPLHEIIPGGFGDTALDQQIREVIISGRTLHRQRMTYRAPDVSMRTYAYSICRVQMNGGSSGAILVMDDLTELRLLEHQGEKLATLGMVIGGIAHEIRSPLGVSSAAAQLMRRRMASPSALEECIGKVIVGIDRASLIVERLLRFARPGPIMETKPVDVYDMLKTALTFAAAGAAAGTAIAWRLPERNCVIQTQGVRKLLELMLTNLMLNAFQAMPDGGILTISFWHAGAVFIEIGDTGHGIAQANLSKIFDPFFSMRNDSRRPGLGLSVCQSIISEHGGTVTVRTSARDGTAFTVRLPDIAAPASVAS